MPTKAERQAQLQLIDDAVELLEREGADADGQVIVTRKSARAIARAAHRRGAHTLVMDAPLPTNRVRAFVEGRPADDVRRQLRKSTVEVIEVARDSTGVVGSTEPVAQAGADGVSTEAARRRRIR